MKCKLFFALGLIGSMSLGFSQTPIGSLEDRQRRSSFREEEKGFFNSIGSFSFNEAEEDKNGEIFTLLDTHFLATYNSHYPHGMNDESFWQGRGVNAYFSGGFKLQYKGFSLTAYPDVWYALNQGFDLVTPLTGEYGSFLAQLDNPQRYGDEFLLSPGLGQSEIRYTGEKLTLGIGNQSLWLGPGIYNSLILSNNAGGFPKLDIGMRKIDTPAGEFEFLAWWGFLTESDYFVGDSVNNKNLITGLHIDYKPPFIKGLTVGFNRTLIANFADVDLSSFGYIFAPFMNFHYGEDKNDQRASITLDWIFPEIGFNVYMEWGKNDFSSNIRSIILFPQHTEAYTIGARQRVYEKAGRRVVVTLEVTQLLISWNYILQGGNIPTFYGHHITRQGYTQNGQLLGAGIGSGSNSQTLDVTFFHKKGLVRGYIQRVSRSEDYLFSQSIDSGLRDSDYNNVELTFGVEGSWKILDIHHIKLGFEYSHNINWNFILENDVNNFHIELGYTLTL